MFLVFAKRTGWHTHPNNNTPKLVGVAKSSAGVNRVIQDAIQLNGSGVHPSSKSGNMLLNNGIRLWAVNVPEAACVNDSYLFSTAIDLF